MTILKNRALPVALLLCGEVVALAALYQVLNLVECSGTDAYGACRFLRSLAARGLAVFAAALIYAWARPAGLRAFAEGAAAHPSPRPWALVHAAGVALLVLPAILGGGRDLTGAFAEVAPVLALGSALAAVGGLFWLAPPRVWVGLLSSDPVALPAALAVAALIPDIADFAQPLWGLQGLTSVTFAAVQALLSLASPATVVDRANYVIGVDDFVVQIARACSGVEGFALVAGFVVIYAALFHREVRPWRLLAVLLPLGIALSWGLNVVRIAGLILIGAHVSPELAVNGFHSYAGWLFFLLLALGLLYAAHAVPWFQRQAATAAAPPARPLREDALAALILPFVAFMFASVAAGAFFRHPELGYPLKAAAMAAAVVYWLPAYRALEWRLDPLSLGAGVLVGLFWLVLAEPGAEGGALADALADLAPTAFAAWALVRVLGTVFLVPLVEEAFFRGYVLARVVELRPGSWPVRIAGIALSSALFAALHGRWIAAGGAGIVFSLLMLRRQRLGDAVQAHVAANLVIAAIAAVRGDWSLI
jgi:exosortase E/protease (VPEID-CTERM system)